MARSKAQVVNSLHNLGVTYAKLQHEYWVLRSEMGYETATVLQGVIDNVGEKVKELNAELAVREAIGE